MLRTPIRRPGRNRTKLEFPESCDRALFTESSPRVTHTQIRERTTEHGAKRGLISPFPQISFSSYQSPRPTIGHELGMRKVQARILIAITHFPTEICLRIRCPSRLSSFGRWYVLGARESRDRVSASCPSASSVRNRFGHPRPFPDRQ
jgi:hypothetical protein